MFRIFLAQTQPVQLVMLVCFNTLTLLASYRLVMWLAARDRKIPGSSIPVGPFFGSITGVFALLLAFNTGSLWSNQHEAERAVRDSASAAIRLEHLLGPDGVNSAEGTAALRRLLDATLHDEWAHGNSKPSPKATEALRDLLNSLVRVATTAPGPVGSELFHLYNTIVKARSDRLWIGMTHRNPGTWIAIILLGIISQIAVGLVHADRPHVARRTMALFTFAITVAYGLLVTSTNPLGTVEHLLPMLEEAFLKQI